jgi:hypothetical protein
MKFTELIKRIQHISESISPDDLADAIMDRLEREHPGTVSRHGAEVVGDAILSVAERHTDGSVNDLGALVQEVMLKLKQPMQEVSDSEQIENPPDRITMDVPLLLRMLEYAREDAKTDMDLHDVTQNLIKLSQTGKTLSMSDYEQIIRSTGINNRDEM